MNEIFVRNIEGGETAISLEEIYALMSFLETMDISIDEMTMSYLKEDKAFVLSKIVGTKLQNVYFKFDLKDDYFILKNEIKRSLCYDLDKVSLYQEFAKFIREGDEIARYTAALYHIYDRNDNSQKINDYSLSISIFLDNIYKKYGEMGYLTIVPIIRDSYEISENYDILDGVNNNKMIKKRY